MVSSTVPGTLPLQCLQDAAGEVVLPVSQPQLLDCMRPGDEVSIGRYLAMDQEDLKSSLAVLSATPGGVLCEAG